MTPPSPRRVASRAAAAASFTGSCETPGIVPIGDGASIAALKKSGQTKWRGESVVSRTRARRAGVARSRRGRTVGKAIVTAVG